MIPKISNYGQYSNNNYGAHTLAVEFEKFTLFYSYDTIVAYKDIDDGFVCSENVWGNTTGKHLNWLEPNKRNRVPNKDFELILQMMLERRTK